MNIYLMLGLVVFGFIIGIRLLGGLMRFFLPFYHPFASPMIMQGAAVPPNTEPSPQNGELMRILLAIAVAGLILLWMALDQYNIRITFQDKESIETPHRHKKMEKERNKGRFTKGEKRL